MVRLSSWRLSSFVASNDRKKNEEREREREEVGRQVSLLSRSVYFPAHSKYEDECINVLEDCFDFFLFSLYAIFAVVSKCAGVDD